MSTSYWIYPGYDAGPRDAEWLRRTADNLDLDRVKTIALDMGCPQNDGHGESLDAYINAYRTRNDLTIKYVDDYQPDPERTTTTFAIWQCASGGGASRTIKECLRKAVFIVLLTEATKRGINLDLRSS